MTTAIEYALIKELKEGIKEGIKGARHELLPSNYFPVSRHL